MTVGDRIKARRESLGMSQGDLASIMNVSRQAISKAEHHDSDITMDKVRKFAAALNCSEASLMGWTEKSAEEKLVEAYAIGKERNNLGTITMAEIDVLCRFRELNEESQHQILEMIAFFKQQEKK